MRIHGGATSSRSPRRAGRGATVVRFVGPPGQCHDAASPGVAVVDLEDTDHLVAGDGLEAGPQRSQHLSLDEPVDGRWPGRRDIGPGSGQHDFDLTSVVAEPRRFQEAEDMWLRIGDLVDAEPAQRPVGVPHVGPPSPQLGHRCAEDESSGLEVVGQQSTHSMAPALA